MEIEKLKALVVRLKTGEYNGTDIMNAWIAIEELIIIKTGMSARRFNDEYIIYEPRKGCEKR